MIPTEVVMRIRSKGQVTIPVEICERLGLLPDTEVTFEVVGPRSDCRRRRGRADGERPSSPG